MMNRQVYQITSDYSYAFVDVTKQKGEASSLDLSDDTPELIPEFDYGWITVESEEFPDLILIMSKLLGIDAKVYPVLAPFVSELGVIELNFSVDQFKILTNIPCLEGVLNIQRSRVTRFSTGDIMSIESPVFLPGDYPPIFKIGEMPTSFFCSEALFNVIQAKGLKGWNFAICPVKKKGWF